MSLWSLKTNAEMEHVLLAVSLLVGLGLLFVGEQIVNIVETVHEAVLLIAVDFKVLALASGQIGNGLVGQVDTNLGFGVGLDGSEESGKELL